MSSTAERSPLSPSIDGGIRKKMRKGTHSCFECRRRKIRCIFPSNNPNVCTECFSRGSRCIDQEHADPNVIVDHRKNLRERVARLEGLLDVLLDERNEKPSQTLKTSMPHTGLPPSPVSGASHQSSKSPEALYSIFSDSGWPNNQDETHKPHVPVEKESDNGHIAAPGTSDDIFVTLPLGNSKAKDERATRLLKEAMPPMEVLHKALEAQAEWWTKITTCMVGPGGTPKEFTCIFSFAKWALAAGTPLEVAKVLQFHMQHQGGYDELEKNLDLIEQVIIQDDEYMGTLSGVEVTFVQARHYCEIGQIRRAWLTTRRALSFAQLMGLHRTRINVRQDFVFWGLFQFDRFCSLMLGSPPLLNDLHCNLTFKGKDLPLVMSNNGFLTRLAMVAGKVLDRVQGSKDMTFASLLSVDQEITRLGSQMPPEFWQLEEFAPQDFQTGNRWLDKSIGQIMYHETRMVLHLPYLLRSVTNAGFEYSREACIESAREVIRIFLKIRSEANSKYNKVKGVDFIALIAAITIVMGLIGGIRQSSNKYDHVRQQQLDQHDWDLLDNILQTYRRVENQPFGRIASQSRRVLERLTQFKDPHHQPEEAAKIVIPFFGTITVQRDAFRRADSSTPMTTSESSPLPSQSIPPESPGIGRVHIGGNTGMPSSHNHHHSAAAVPVFGGHVAYNGVYLQPSPYENDQYFQSGLSGMSDHISLGYLPPGYAPQNVGTFDLDQEWNWDLTSMEMGDHADF